MKFRLKNLIAYIPFAYYYVGPAAFVSYILAGKSLFSKYSHAGVLLTLALAGYFVFMLGANGAADGLYVIRFFWGFLIFYLIFRSGIHIRTDKLLIFLSALTLAEAVLINTVIPAESMPNFPTTEMSSHFAEEGDYQRPYSFGGSASVTSVILVALLSISKIGRLGQFTTIAAIGSCMSGSGFVALFIYLFAKIRPFLLIMLLPLLVGVIYSGEFYKISADYIGYLFQFKVEQFATQIPTDSILLGIPLEGELNRIGGDFALLSFITLNGLIGLFFLLLIVLLNLNKKNWLAALILLTGTIHYGVIFFLPGQLMFGYVLSLKAELVEMNTPAKS